MKRAENNAHSETEVRTAFEAALFREFPVQVLRVVRDSLGERVLFASLQHERLESIRTASPGSAAASALIDCAQDSLRLGRAGDDAMTLALAEASRDVAESFLRGMEEHVERSAQGQRAGDVIARLRAAALAIDFDRASRELLAPPSGARRRRQRALRLVGLDEGPQL